MTRMHGMRPESSGVDRWQRLGCVYVADSPGAWASSHAYCPTPLLLNATMVRVYCAFLDARGIGRIGFVDVAADDPLRVLAVSTQPALDVGRPGRFDEHGVTPISVVPHPDGERTFLYYAGWQRGVGVRYFLFSGLAISGDAEFFTRASECPILDRCDGESLVRTSPMVTHDAGVWRMWYSAGDSWEMDPDGVERPRYHLRETASADGISWRSPGTPCDFDSGGDTAIGRACVKRDGGRWRMWFSHRSGGGPYSIGYASSDDGATWIRNDAHAGIGLGPRGSWDDQMIGLSAIITTDFGTYLFYNGNEMGRTGFGVARLTSVEI